MSAVLLDRCGRPEEGKLLVPDLARRILRPRDLRDFGDDLEVYQELFGQAGGAGTNIVPNESLNMQLAGMPLASRVRNPLTLYMRLFTSQTSTTVPSDDSLLTGGAGGVPSGTSPVAEVAASGGYASVAMAGGGGAALSGNQWGAPAQFGSVGAAGAGRQTTAAQQSFPQSTASWGTINGFFIATCSNTAANGITLAAPTGLTATATAAGGGLASTFAGGVQVFYKVTAVTPGGETTGSNEASATPTNAQVNALAWTAPTGPQPTAYRVYRTTVTNGETTSPALVAEVPGSMTSYVDTGAAQGLTGTALSPGAVPASNTAEQGVAVFYANFSDGLAVNINGAGFTLQVTPTFVITHV